MRVGVVGTGFAAASHVDSLTRVRDVEIAAIAASSKEKAEAAAARFGIERSFGNYHDLLEDGSIDAVHNCTPNYLHAQVNRAVLRAGKHLLSEKPLAMDSSETARLVDEAAGAGVVSGVCFNYRHYPLVRQVKTMIASGEHGPIHLVHGGYLQDWLLYETDWNWRLDATKGGVSRAIADIGSHWMDLVQHVTDQRIVEVFAALETLHATRRRPAAKVETFAGSGDGEGLPVDVGTEDAGTVLFRLEGGARGAFIVSQVSAGWKNRLFFEVDAARSSFAWDQEEPNRLRIGRRSDANLELVRDPALLSPEAASLAHFPGGHQEGWPDGLKNLFLDFYGAVGAHGRGEAYGASFATFEDAHRITRAVEAILASHRAGQWQKIEDRTSEESQEKLEVDATQEVPG